MITGPASETVAALLPILQFLVTAGGAGIAASWIFDALRALSPAPEDAPTNPLAAYAALALHSPRYSRVTVLVVAQLVGLVASVLLALVEGREIAPAVDMFAAALISQLWHARTLSSSVPVASGALADDDERPSDLLDVLVTLEDPSEQYTFRTFGPLLCTECLYRWHSWIDETLDGQPIPQVCPSCSSSTGLPPKVVQQ